MPNLVDLVKQAAVEAVEAGKPLAMCYGTVTAATPLKIALDQKITLFQGQMILTDAVRDYDVEMIVGHTTETQATQHTHNTPNGNTGAPEPPTDHAHPYSGTKTYRILKALKTGERVVLLRLQGGQKYIVLDRVR